MSMEIKMHEVVTQGMIYTAGQDELDSLLQQGWQIIHCDDSETWVNGDGYECRAYKYKLIRQ